MGGRPGQEDQREAPATGQVRVQHWDSERGTERTGSRGCKVFLTYNNMLNDCDCGVYGKGWMSDGGGEGRWTACDAMTETTQQKRMGRQEGLSGAVRARRHGAGSHVEPLSGRQQQTMNSDETSQEPIGQRIKGGDCPGLEPRGLSGRQGEREKGAGSKGQEAVRSCRTRITLLRVGAMMAVQSMQWGRNWPTGVLRLLL